jgi:hypothetical protein
MAQPAREQYQGDLSDANEAEARAASVDQPATLLEAATQWRDLGRQSEQTEKATIREEHRAKR